MTLVKWDASFNIGLETFDRHHRHLVTLLNNIYRSVINQNPDKSLEESFQGLIAYCDYHFKAEEMWMADRHAPEQARHIASHRKFLQDIFEFQEQFHHGQTLISFGLLKYLRDWLLNHILDEDQQMASHHPSSQTEASGNA